MSFAQTGARGTEGSEQMDQLYRTCLASCQYPKKCKLYQQSFVCTGDFLLLYVLLAVGACILLLVAGVLWFLFKQTRKNRLVSKMKVTSIPGISLVNYVYGTYYQQMIVTPVSQQFYM